MGVEADRRRLASAMACLKKMEGGPLRWRGPRGFGRRIYFGDFRDVGCVSSFF
jgi:hypothetical protein